MHDDVEGRVGEVRMEGDSKGTLMGVPEGTQSQDYPETHSINLVALSLAWPGGREEEPEWEQLLGMGASAPVTSGITPFTSKNRESTQR